MRNVFAIVARKVIMEAPHNVLSIIETIEELNLFMPAGAPPNGILVTPGENVFTSLWELEVGDTGGRKEAKFWIDTPRGRWIEMPAYLDFQDKIRTRSSVQMDGFPLFGGGVATYAMECEGIVAKWNVTINVTDVDPRVNFIQADSIRV